MKYVHISQIHQYNWLSLHNVTARIPTIDMLTWMVKSSRCLNPNNKQQQRTMGSYRMLK